MKLIKANLVTVASKCRKAGLLAFLAPDKTKFVTMQVIIADGGALC
jgi:hypothetical protein